MNTRVSRRWLIVALAALTMLPPARADIVATDQLAAPAPVDAERARVKTFLERATVTEKLQAMGVDTLSVADRVDAMDAEEIHMLAKSIDSLPAGGDFTTTEIIVIVLLAILLIAII